MPNFSVTKQSEILGQGHIVGSLQPPTTIPAGTTLVDAEGHVWLAYDIARASSVKGPFRPLHEIVDAWHAGVHAGRPDFARATSVAILNGMGVALGDSVIGCNSLHWLSRHHPDLQIQLYRARHAPDYVEQLYRLIPWWGPTRRLPTLRSELERDHRLIVDVGDVISWPQFVTMPMVDFFFWALGIDPHFVPAEHKRNRWLSQLAVAPPPARGDYVLFFPTASAALRTMPSHLWRESVQRVWEHYGLPVFGVEQIEHPHYTCVTTAMATTESFISWIAGSRSVVGVDSSAIHIAAGFDVPTVAFFTSIDPALRVGYYPFCSAIDLRVPATTGLHTTEDPGALSDINFAWEAAFTQRWNWPDRSESARASR